jgi:hypothetical protein
MSKYLHKYEFGSINSSLINSISIFFFLIFQLVASVFVYD